MAFKYDPKSASDCLPAGEYNAQLDSVEETVSKSSGNAMLEVVWLVVDQGRDWRIYDYIVNPGGNSAGTIWKLKKIARAWGMGPEFDNGTFDLNEYRGRIITLKLIVQQQDGYSDKNSVKDYLPMQESDTGKRFGYDPGVPQPLPQTVGDRDIPF